MAIPATRSKAAVYATTAFSRHERVNGGYVRLPAGLVHAKTWGSATALCGANSGTWPKFYDMSFFRVEKNRCPECTSAALTMTRRDPAPAS